MCGIGYCDLLEKVDFDWSAGEGIAIRRGGFGISMTKSSSDAIPFTKYMTKVPTGTGSRLVMYEDTRKLSGFEGAAMLSCQKV